MKLKRGRSNPNYKGVANIMDIIRIWATNYWRPQVFERDEYTCQHCGKTSGGDLNAHHIVPLSKIVSALMNLKGIAKDSSQEERIEFTNFAIEHPLVCSLDNGITLCVSCHRKIHKIKIKK